MILDQQATVPAPVDRVWAFINDIPAVSRCMPGVEEFTAVGSDAYEGALKVKVGPIAVRLQGKVVVAERDPVAHVSRLDVQASERRINSTVNAKATLTLRPISASETQILVHTEAAILGKLGEFGQAVMRRKGDQMMQEFAANMARALQQGG